MDFRTRRQFVILLLLAAIAGGIGYAVFLNYKPHPTCEDKRQNQLEEDVDCGGPCIPCALRHKKAIDHVWARFVKTGDEIYDVAARLRNPNVRLAAHSFEYEFRLFDTAGVLVATRKGRSFAYPDETIHIVEIGLQTKRSVERVDIAVSNEQWVLTETIAPDIIAGNRQYIVEDIGGVRRGVASAQVVNRTLADMPEVIGTALLLDDNDNLIGVHRTLIRDLAAGEARTISWVWSPPVTEEAHAIIIEPRSRQLIPRS